MSRATTPRRGAPGRARVPRAIREREMVEAAERVFTQQGYAGASMDEIASACGVSKPMLYAYFGSKEGLFAACGGPHGEQIRDRLRAASGRGEVSADQRLWRGLLAMFAVIDEDRETWTLLNPPRGPAPGGALAARSAMNRAAMVELVTELMRDGARAAGITSERLEQVDALAHVLVGAVYGAAAWWMKHPDEPAEAQALRVMNVAWRGLESLQAGDPWIPGEPA